MECLLHVVIAFITALILGYYSTRAFMERLDKKTDEELEKFDRQRRHLK